MGGRKDKLAHTGTDEGHYYSPSPPTSGDNKLRKFHTQLNIPRKQMYLSVICYLLVGKVLCSSELSMKKARNLSRKKAF